MNEFEIITTATLTCPECGLDQRVEMPTDACQHFYRCVGCGTILKPKEGDCCVFCSYADVPCPPKQRERAESMKSPTAKKKPELG